MLKVYFKSISSDISTHHARFPDCLKSLKEVSGKDSEKSLDATVDLAMVYYSFGGESVTALTNDAETNGALAMFRTEETG